MTKHILSGVQVGDIKQVNVLNLFKIKKYYDPLQSFMMMPSRR